MPRAALTVVVLLAAACGRGSHPGPDGRTGQVQPPAVALTHTPSAPAHSAVAAQSSAVLLVASDTEDEGDGAPNPRLRVGLVTGPDTVALDMWAVDRPTLLGDSLIRVVGGAAPDGPIAPIEYHLRTKLTTPLPAPPGWCIPCGVEYSPDGQYVAYISVDDSLDGRPTIRTYLADSLVLVGPPSRLAATDMPSGAAKWLGADSVEFWVSPEALDQFHWLRFRVAWRAPKWVADTVDMRVQSR